MKLKCSCGHDKWTILVTHEDSPILRLTLVCGKCGVQNFAETPNADGFNKLIFEQKQNQEGRQLVKWCRFHNLPMCRCYQTSSMKCEEVLMDKDVAIRIAIQKEHLGWEGLVESINKQFENEQ